MLFVAALPDARSALDEPASRGKSAVFNERSARQTYLENMGVTKGDPFILPVSEQEQQFFQPASTTESRQPLFFDLVAPPPLAGLLSQSVDQSLQRLRQPGTTVIYGAPGSGKTTLRLALDAALRQKPDYTLSITYTTFPDQSSPEHHWQAIARELAVDLFIQSIEQFESFPKPTPEQIEALHKQISIGDLSHLIERICDDPRSASLWGLATYWPSVHRSVVRRVASSPALLDILRDLRDRSDRAIMPPSGQAALLEGLRAARLWGFKRALVLIDGIDTPDRNVRGMQTLTHPLVEGLPDWELQGLNFMFLLPHELQKPIKPVLRRVARRLTSPLFESIIGPWDDVSLRRLLVQRWRAGGSRRLRLEAGPGLEGRLDELVIRSANGLPRRLLQIVSRLIDQHAARDPYDRTITLTDWKRMRSSWPKDDRPVPLLPSDI